ncbi:MAG: hypothetical protein WEB03_05205 [Nitriliruptor sp.]|uniref:hypothetical protein n=1 Tax=Nitriliruptor sp. TaxID=2448056 RepID=UPI0034A08F2E
MGLRTGLPDLVVVHADARGARRCIERLSRAGVDGGAIELLGRIEVTTAGRAGDRQTDRGSSLAVGGRALRGALWGVPPGAVFGAALLVVTSGQGIAVLAAGLAGGAAFGAGVGVLTALLTLPTMASSWERTFAPLVPGGVAVGVRGLDARTLRRARRVLRGLDARTVHEVADLDDLPDGSVAELEHPEPAGGDGPVDDPI